VLGEIAQVVIVLGSSPLVPERTKPPLPLPRSLFTRASAMVGTDCSSLYAQLTVWTIKLEQLGP